MNRTLPVRAWLGAGLLALSAGVAFAGDPPPSPPPVPKREVPDAAAWTKALASDDVAARRDAIYKLWNAGDAAGDVSAAVARALADSDAYVRDTAFRILERMKDGAKDSVPTIAAMLSSDREEVRQSAGSLLYKLGKLSVDVVPALTKALESDDAKVRELAAGALGNAGPAAEPAREALTRLLDDDVPDVQTQAVGAIVSLDPIAAFKNPSAAVRTETIGRLQNGGLKDAAIVDALFGAFADEKSDIRAGAAYALGTAMLDKDVPWRDRAGATAIAAWPKESVPAVRAGFAYMLARAPAQAEAAVPLLLEALDSMNSDLKSMANQAFMGLGPRAKAALPRLLARIESHDEHASNAAAFLLGYVGTDEPAVVAALRKVLVGASARLSTTAALALGQLRAAPAIPELLAIAVDPKGDIVARTQCAFSLAVLGEAAKGSVEALEKAATGDATAPPALTYAVLCLSAKPPAAASERLLAWLLGDDLDRRQRSLAALAQGAQSKAAEGWMGDMALSILVATESKDAKRRARSVAAIPYFSNGRTLAESVLKRLAKSDPDPDVRKEAANSMITLGFEASQSAR